jgi:hypothetical protein
MTRSKALILILLLVAFIGVWATTRRPIETARPTASVSPAQENPRPAVGLYGNPEKALEMLESPSQVTSPSEGELVKEPSIDRDPFELPRLLKETLLEKQRQKEEQERAGRSQGLGTPSQPEVQLPPLKLQGVFWGTPRPQAIINRKILSVGDTIEEAKVIAVAKEGVKLSYREREFVLKLPQQLDQQGGRHHDEY